MSLQKLLESTISMKQEIEQTFAVKDQTLGTINYESISFTFKILPPIKPLALNLAEKYFKVHDGIITIEGEGISGLAEINSNIQKWIADMKDALEG